MNKHKLSWKFPGNNFTLLRLEMVFLIIIAIIVFIFSYYDFDQRWYIGLVFTLIFLVAYFLVSSIVQRIRMVQNTYRVTPSHIEIHHQHRFGEKKSKIPLGNLKHHKTDRTFLGGYLVTHKGERHSLFFNTKKEIERFEAFLRKHKRK